eukprot:3634734-Pleurochrysis_carterae.AAC.3
MHGAWRELLITLVSTKMTRLVVMIGLFFAYRLLQDKLEAAGRQMNRRALVHQIAHDSQRLR